LHDGSVFPLPGYPGVFSNGETYLAKYRQSRLGVFPTLLEANRARYRAEESDGETATKPLAMGDLPVVDQSPISAAEISISELRLRQRRERTEAACSAHLMDLWRGYPDGPPQV
jgi:hypothetical protein